MADGEAERVNIPGPDVTAEIPRLEDRLRELESRLRRDSGDEAVKAASEYCQRFCQALLEYAEKWKAAEHSLSLLEVYIVAIRGYAKARPHLTSACENVALVLERLTLSCVELLLCLPHELPDERWLKFQYYIQDAHKTFTENGSHELSLLYNISLETGVWKDSVLQKILYQEAQDPYMVSRFLISEGPLLLEMRIKRLLKLCKVAPATSLAKLCSDHPEMSKKGNFKQIYLTCLCADAPNITLIEEIAKVDCKDALDMICNLESDGDEKTSLILCAAFLSRQLQFGEMYCAWELTLFWSKLQRRVDPSIQIYLERCRQLSLLTKTVFHIFFLIKVIQSETEGAGLPTSIELCVRALRLESSENARVKIFVCKTISCLLPDDLEVKRACQLTEFLLEPTVDAYYAVEMLYNQPDQKYDEESLPVPNSLRCEMLLVLKTRWPFDPEFWDWKTLKRQCLALMGKEASIVSSIDELNDNEVYDPADEYHDMAEDSSLNGLECFENSSSNTELEKKEKRRHMKKRRERGCISERFRNWQAYMQYCVLCDKEFLGHRIVRHAQKHCKDGIYSCPICAQEYNSKESFVPHVTLHVKQSCKERLEIMGPTRKPPSIPKKAPVYKNKKTVKVSKQDRPIKKNSLYSDDFIVFNDNDNSDDNDDRDKQSESLQTGKQVIFDEFPCPVQFCKKGFKYYKNLIAHVKSHKDSEEATRFLEIQSKKVICQYCRRQFVSVTHLNDHLQIHCGSLPYICIQMKCKASFKTYADLLAHRKQHRIFRARCMFPKCGRIFSAAYMLFDHEAQHYNTFTCKNNGCGKIYHSQLQLENHLCEHTADVASEESKCNTNAELTITPKTETSNEHINVEEKSPPEASISNDYNAVPLPLASNVAEPILDKDLNLTPTVLPQTLPSVAVEQTMHLLDHHLPPSNDILSSSDLINPVMQSSALSLTQSIPPKNDILTDSDTTASSSNVKLPMLNQDPHDLLLNTNKQINTFDEKSMLIHPGFEDTSLPAIVGCKVSCPNGSIQDQVASIDCHGNKINVQCQVNNIMPFNVEHPAPTLSENNLVMSRDEESIKSENALSLSLETSSLLSNVLPPVSNAPVTSLSHEKFKCNVEACTRIFNSVQSIGKHMKTTHPDHYADFKMERKNRKKINAGKSGQIPSDERTYQILPGADATCTSNFQSPEQNTANTNVCNTLQHVQNTVFPTHIDNLVNPLLNSVESIITEGLSKTVADTLLGPEVGNLSNAALTSQLEDFAKVVLPLKFENGSDPFLPMPTENEPLPVLSSLSGSSMYPQLGSNTDHDPVLSGGDPANVFLKAEADAETSFTKQDESTDLDTSFNLEKSSSMLSNSPEKKTGTERQTRNRERKPKPSARAKCPAIIRDGKFICSRCFRVFTNPRSLGGHLSKRAVCKPHNDFHVSHVPPTDGQSSVLDSMILPSSPKQTLLSPPQTFSPEVTPKTEPVLKAISHDSQAAQFLQSGLTHPSTPNFTPCENKDDRELKQALGPPTTVVNPHVPLNLNSEGCILDGNTVTPSTLSNMITPHIVQTTHNPDRNMLYSNANCGSTTSLPEESCVNAVENGLSSSPMLISTGEDHCGASPVSSARVSVISGPQSSCLASTKKKGVGTKKKNKNVEPPAADGASHKHLASVGSLPANVGGNLQTPTDLQTNFMAYGSELLENIAKHLNSADKQLFLSCINESLKASSEIHTLSQVSTKLDKIDIQPQPHLITNRIEQAELGMQTDFIGKPFDNSASDSAVVFPVNSSLQNVCSTLPPIQDLSIGNVADIPGTVQNMIPPSSPGDKMNIPVCYLSPTQGTNVKLDSQVAEIMDLVQKLQLIDNSLPEDLAADPDSERSHADALPQTSSVIVANPSLNVVHDDTDEVSKPLIDKCNAKPFICQENDCTYCAMTKDALFKHYAKVHYYTQEKIIEIKKHQLKFAPFRCVVPSCTKTFTRNSNLRAHCQSMHHFTSEQMVKLKIKRPYGKKSLNENMNSLVKQMSPKIVKAEKSTELNIASPVVPKKEPEDYQSKPILEAIEPPNLQVLKTPLVLPTPELAIVQSLNLNIQKNPKIKKKRKDMDIKHKKNLQKDAHGLTSYKPYKCVHQGCTAAFTIQQNLILHYQAIHKSDMFKFSLEEDVNDEWEDCENDLKEFRCMETDCSRIFQEVASLIQHYAKFHEMIAEEIENVISFVHVGQFKCDQHQCSFAFTTCSEYIDHLEGFHDIKTKQLKLEGEEMYKCDCEGCDRVYATRSNLLRHIFHKHNDKHKEHLLRPRKISLSDQDSQEEKGLKEKPRVPKTTVQSAGFLVLKTKMPKENYLRKDSKVTKGQSKPGPLSLKCGRHTYSLKPKDTALEECMDNLPDQYPCMVRGCTSIVANELNIIRHYKCHKLSRAFVLKHRKSLIVCKRLAHTKVQAVTPKLEPAEGTNKTEAKEEAAQQRAEAIPSLTESSDESTISTSQQSETEKDEMDELAELFTTKLSNEDSSDSQGTSSCQSEPQRNTNLKRDNKQKHADPSRPSAETSSTVNIDSPSAETSSTVGSEETIKTLPAAKKPPAFDLSSFKPMGFEFTFLKFLKESAAKKRKPAKTILQPAMKRMRLSEKSGTDPYLRLANPSRLPDLDNIKINLGQSFKGPVDLAVKQLNELKAVVVLKRRRMFSDAAASPSKKQKIVKDGEADV
ncbi:zinc finger protein 292 [Pelodytes ibericus]